MTQTLIEAPATAPDTAASPTAAQAKVLPPQISRLRRIGKDPRLMQYNRLIVGVLAANAVLLIIGINSGWWSADSIDLTAISNAALANFALAILIRQQYVVNLLFWLATRAPTTWLLKIRSLTYTVVAGWGGVSAATGRGVLRAGGLAGGHRHHRLATGAGP